MSSISMRGVVSGVLGLTALQAITSTPAAAARTGGLFTGLATAFKYLASSAYPLIPDRRSAAEQAAAAAKKKTGSSGGTGNSGLPKLGPITPGTAPPTTLPNGNPAPQVAPTPVPTRPTVPSVSGHDPFVGGTQFAVTPKPAPGPAPHP